MCVQIDVYMHVHIYTQYIAWGGHKTYAVAMNNKSKSRVAQLYAKYFYLPQLLLRSPLWWKGGVGFSAVSNSRLATQTEENGVQSYAYPYATAASSCAR